MAETFTLINVWELQVVHFGDQGGCVGGRVGYFESQAVASDWFEKFCAEQPGEDWNIHKEGQKQAMVSDKTLYVVEKGPCKLSLSK
jgi:hypothetical protein